MSPVAEPRGRAVAVSDGPPVPGEEAHGLRVGGLTPLSTRDWPGLLAATVFCQGCPLRCGYCHNPELRPVPAPSALPWSEVLALLERRHGLLDGVVFSGGEPTLQPALGAAMTQVRAAGFAVGLHTSGIHPRRLRRVLPLLDWVGLDIKAPPRLYPDVTASTTAATRALDSLRAVRDAGTPFEVRVTLHPVLDPPALAELADLLYAEGVTTVALQGRTEANGLPARSSSDVPEPLLRAWRDRFPVLLLRGNSAAV